MASNTSDLMNDGGNISTAAEDRVEINDKTVGNARFVIDTDMNAVVDYGTESDEMIDNKLCSINQKKRKQKCDLIVGAQGGNDDCNDVMYEIIERDGKRQKIEVERKLDNCANTVDADNDDDDANKAGAIGDSMIDKRKRSVKPAVPPKPKNLMLHDPSNGLINSQLKHKLVSNHAAAIQKLNAHAEQLRQENNRLKTALSNERTAVRTLKAQSDANFRKEKLRSLKLDDGSKATRSSMSDSKENLPAPISQEKSAQTHIDRLLKELDGLKDSNKELTEKLQQLTKADRQKTADIRQLKDSYEQQLAHGIKVSKVEAHRLLEEIKTKDKTIEALRKDVSALKGNQKHQTKIFDGKSQKMRKKEIELCNTTGTVTNTTTSSTNTTNQTTNNNTTQTTCRHDLYTMPHEMRERILNAQNEMQYCKTKDLSGSDNDSALSSAPPSLSPQPGTQPNSPDVWQALLKDSKDYENLQKEYDLIKEENQFLNCEITLAEEQIRELEKVLQMTRENNKMDELLERIHQLESNEASILKESNELREQNELLEFRIIELEESSADKMNAVHGNKSNGKGVWSMDKVDSGNSSPQEYYDTMACPCDLSVLEQLPSDYVRKNLLSMSKHSCFQEKEKLCLLQVLSLLNNLEALSQDQDMIFDDDNFRSMTVSAKWSKNSMESLPYRSGSFSSTIKSPERAVATVPPYSTKKIDDSPCPKSLPTYTTLKKGSSMSTMSLNESGVFDSEHIEQMSRATQTDVDDFPVNEKITLSSDLCAEIQKLNKFRKKIEECMRPPVAVGNILPPNATEQSRMQYYRDRLELLEKKVSIYESSGEQQVRRLAARLQREIQLESTVKQLREQVEKLEEENQNLDEEKCELEEIENDTRLQLQRLEVDLEILSQRNVELEMSRDTARANVTNLQEAIRNSHESILLLEADRDDVRHKLELLTAFMPAILLYNTWKTQEFQLNGAIMSTNQVVESAVINQTSCNCLNDHNCLETEKFIELLRREQELTENIDELNRAYNETLERADNLWAQMEKDYKDKLTRTQEDNSLLRSKIGQLEKRLKNDSYYAQERISQLEDEENVLKRRLAKLNKISRDDADKYKTLQSDFQTLTTEYEQLKSYVNGTLAENLEKEKRRSKTLEEDMTLANKMYENLEEHHKNEVHAVKSKLERTHRELLKAEVNNGELKEEVLSLENRIIELDRCRNEYEDRINTLMYEIRNKQDQPVKPSRSKHNIRNLAQELNSLNRNNYTYTSVYTLNSVASKISDAVKTFEINREPMRHQFE